MRTLAAAASLILVAGAAPRPLAQSAPEGPPTHARFTPGRKLPFLGDLARDITVSDVRVGLDGAPPSSPGDFVQLAATSRVNNLNFKFDVWLLPFLNVYAIAGYVWNESDTTLELALPGPLPASRQRVTVPTSLEGSVGGLGLTLAGGYGQFFAAVDVNAAQADLGFDDRFQAVVSSLRGAGWTWPSIPAPTSTAAGTWPSSR